jgi:FtsZ-binding cell division protein ZapB
MTDRNEDNEIIDTALDTLAWQRREIDRLTAENERLRNDHASAVAELNKTKALLKGYRRGYKTARAALGDTQ